MNYRIPNENAEDFYSKNAKINTPIRKEFEKYYLTKIRGEDMRGLNS
jgi:hypothetical protein